MKEGDARDNAQTTIVWNTMRRASGGSHDVEQREQRMRTGNSVVVVLTDALLHREFTTDRYVTSIASISSTLQMTEALAPLS